MGVDPGGRHTGVVVRDGPRLLLHHVIASTDVHHVLGELHVIAAAHNVHVVAVEGVTAPTGFKHGKREPINLAGLIGTATMFGAIVATWPDAVVVPPGGNGSGPRGAYPPELFGPREGPAATGRLRHARSAFDVAGLAHRFATVEEAG